MHAHICLRCDRLHDEARGMPCPCRAPHDEAAARRRLRNALARAAHTDAVVAKARKAMAA